MPHPLHPDSKSKASLFHPIETFNSPQSKGESKEISQKEGIKELNVAIIKERSALIRDINDQLQANENLLNEHSLLNSSQTKTRNGVAIKQLIEQFQSQAIDPIKALALTNLSYSALDTSYEGWTLSETAKLYAGVFDIIQAGEGVFSKFIPQEVYSNVAQLKNHPEIKATALQALALESMQAVQNLKSGESWTMPGGWFGIPAGHAMIYRFERTASHAFNIYIYDAQKGSETQKGGEEVEGHKRSHPYIALQNIEWKELFFCEEGQSGNPILFENLLSLQAPTSTPKEHTSSSVLTCFAHLQHRRVPTDKLAALFISMQRSGNCPVKSTDCLILDLFQDPHAYKKASLDIRLLCLVAYYEFFKDQLSKDPLKCDVGLFQLREATRNFLRVLNKNFRKPEREIGQEAYTTACATANHILKELDAWEDNQKSLAGKPHLLKATYDQALVAQESQARLVNAPAINNLLKKVEEKVASSAVIYDPLLGQGASSKDLESVFEKLHSFTQKLKDTENKQNLLFQVETTLAHLSHLKNSPLELSVEKASGLLLQLSKIQEDYTEVLSKLETASPTAQNTAMEFLALSYRLAVAADGQYGVLKDFGVDATFFCSLANTISSDPLFTIQDPLVLEQHNRLKAFFNSKSSNYQIFNLDYAPATKEQFLEGKTAEATFYKRYIDRFPALAKEFSQLATSTNPFPIYGAFRSFEGLSSSSFPPSLRHLYLLKLSSAYALGACGRGKPYSSEENSSFHCLGELCVNTRFYQWNQRESPQLFHQANLKNFSPNKELQDYPYYQQSTSIPSELASENQLLAKELGKKENDPNLPFHTALAAPDVQTSALLSALEDNLDCLSDPKKRRLIGHMLIKLVKGQDGLVSPFMQSLQKEPSLLAKFERLVALGKKNFIDSKPKHNPQVEEMLFLIRYYARALQVVHTTHPNLSYSPATLSLVEELTALLAKLEQLPLMAEQMKSEIQLAKVGLLLAVPLEQQQDKQRIDCFYAMLHLKNSLQSLSTCSDLSFWNKCQRLFFNSLEWQRWLNDPKQRQVFANGVMNQINHLPLNDWTFDGSRLCAQDDLKEEWVIDLKDLNIRNAKGNLVQKNAQLEIPPSFERLFPSKTYDLQFFGDEVWFQDPIWGQIRVTGKGVKTLIQRRIEDKWHTYVPQEEKYKDLLKVNKALFDNHALWLNPDNPQDLLFCDLQTGQTLYHLEKDGRIYENKTGKLFSRLQEKEHPLLERFDSVEQVNGWIDPKNALRKEGNEIIEFSRFCSQEGQPLRLIWEEETQRWKYPLNPAFSLDTHPDRHLDFKVDHFLPLISQDKAKQKILIPCGSIQSEGYSPLANVRLKDSTQLQKGTLTFFEYDLVAGQLIPQSLDAKIYLAHLYLAQKNYQQALHLIESISLSEQVSKTAAEFAANLLFSAAALHDHSPNAHAVRLLAYHRFQTINPFISYVGSTPSKIALLMQGYQVYLDGLNHLEDPLKMNLEVEQELISLFESAAIALENSKPTNLNFNLKDFQNTLKSRKDTLKGQALPKKLFVLSANQTIDKQLPLFDCFFYSSSTEYEANRYFTDQNSGNFLSNFKDFARCYEVLRRYFPSSPQYQAVFYELATAQTLRGVDEQRLKILSIAATYSREAPPLPLEDPVDPQAKDSENAKLQWNKKKLEWYEELKRLYQQSEKIEPGSRFGINRTRIENFKNFAFHSKDLRVKSEEPSRPTSPAHTLDPRFNPSAQKAQEPSAATFARESQDALFESWQDRFLQPKSEKAASLLLANEASTQKPKTVKTTVKASERKYQASIEKHVELYAQDCQIAEVNRKNKRVFKKEVTFDALLPEMRFEHDMAVKAEEELKDFVNQLGNKKPPGFDPFVAQLANQIGQARPKNTLESILRAACQKDSLAALKKLNPALEEKEVHLLRSASLELMMESTHRQHLNRIIQPLDKWLKGGKKQDSYLEEAQEALNEARGYNPKTSPFPLLFEYLSGLRVRPKQVHLINTVFESLFEGKRSEDQEELIGKVFQLIMAGGKTSVILSLLVEMVSEAGLIACVMSHHSQMASVTGSLADFQSKRFAKDIYVLDYTIQDLSKPEILDFILKRLSDADSKSCALVMKSTFPQLLELKFIMELLRLRNTPSDKERKKLGEVISKLQKINKIFSDKGVGFFDECDTTLSMLLDVIIPLGQPKTIKPERAGIVSSIFEHLVGDKEILSLINLQDELAKEDLDNKVLPFIADKMFSHLPLKLHFKPELKAAFKRFVCDQITPEEQKLANETATHEQVFSNKEQAENVAFLRYLQTLAASSNRYEQEAAHLISLVRQVSLKVLHISLSRAYNRGYGKDPSNDNGKVVPFLAARAPATTQFGNIYLALAYHAQTAINDTISQGEVSFLAKKMEEAANYYARKEKIAFEDTLEAQQFFEMTSVRLSDISSGEQMKKALAYLNDPEHSTRRLAFAAELAPFHVHYHEQMVGSNAINSVSQFKKAVADSATLWNHSTYHSGFGTPALDKGTEGSILNLLTARAEQNPNCIHTLSNTTLDDFLTAFHQHPNKKKLRGLADGGGFLKAYSNETVAKTFMQFFEQEETQGGPPIEGIVYLHKFSADEAKKMGREESFMLLKKGQTNPILLSNTSTEEIEKLGVKKDNLFALYDELRTTGTNILLDGEALIFNTVDHKMPVRSFLQAVLRARGIFKDQQVEYLVTKNGRAEMINGGKTFLDIKDTVIRNEAIMLKEQQDRSRFAQIDDVIRSAIIRELFQEEKIDKLEALMKKYETFLVTTFEDNPYKQFGRIRGRGLAVEILSDYAKEVLNRFKATLSPSFKQVSQKIDNLIERFKRDIPEEEMDLALNENLEATVEVEQEQELNVELEQEQEVELNQELQTELNTYSFNCQAGPYKERSWDIKGSEKPLWDLLQPHFNKGEPRLFAVSDVLSRSYRGAQFKQVSTAAYAPCFPTNFLMTENFYRTLNEELPIFHPSSKRANFMLAVETEKGAYQFILVSEQEAAYFKNWLDKNKSAHAHLVDMNGVPEINAEIFYAQVRQKEQLSEQFLQGLWHANLFNGNVNFLEQHAAMSRELIGQKEPLMAKFLQLRAANNKQSLRQLMMSDLFNFDISATHAQPSGLLFSKRRLAIEEKYNQIRKWGQAKIALLDPLEVESIAPHQVGWLTTKEQIGYLSPNLVNHLLPSQMHLLPLDKVPHLAKAELIQTLKDDKQIQCLKGKQVESLLQSQVNAMEASEVKNLTAAQISWLAHPHLIKEINPSYVRLIKKDNRAYLEKIETLLALPDGEGLKPNQTMAIQQHFKAKEDLKESELKPWQIPHLPKGHISQLKNPEHICNIPLEHAPEITKEQAKHLKTKDSKFINALSHEAISGIDPSLTYLMGKEHIQQFELPTDQALIFNLSAEQATHLSDSALQGINPAIVNQLNYREVKRLENPTLLLALEEEQAQALNAKQEDHLKRYLSDHHASLKETELKPWHILYLPRERISQLKDPKFKHKIELGNLKLPRDQTTISKLNVAEASYLNKEALQGIDPSLVNHLSKRDVERLENPTLLLACEEERAQLLSEEQRKNLKLYLADHHTSLKEAQLKPWQVPYLPKERLSQLKESTLIHAIPAEYASTLTEEQAKCLKRDDQALIAGLTPQALQGLDHRLYDLLSQEQIGKLKLPDNQTIISRLNPEQASHLSNGSLQGVDPSLVNHLSKRDVERLENPLLLLACEEGRAELLNGKQRQILKDYLAHHHHLIQEAQLKPWQVPYLPKERLSQLKEPTLIHAIPAEYASALTEEQAKCLQRGNQALIAGLTPKALQGLDHRLYDLISKEQIGQLKLPGDQKIISRLSAQQASHLDKASLQGINSSLVNHLSKRDVERLENPLLLLACEEERAKLLNGKQTQILKDYLADHHYLIEEAQLKLWQVPHLPKERILALKTPKLIGKIPLEYASEMTEEQARSLSRNDQALIAQLNSTALRGLDHHLYDLLTNGQIGQLRLPGDQGVIFQLDARQALHLNNAALQGINPALVNRLSDRDIKRLREPHLLLSLSEENLAKIEPEQGEILSREFGRMASREAISRLRDDQLKFLPALQIPLMPFNKAFCLSERQWVHLSKRQVEDVKAHMASRITREFVNALSTEALEALSQEHATYLRAERVSELGERHTSLIRGIRSDRLLSQLSETALQRIAPEQLQLIEAGNFQRIRDPELLFNAPERCSAWLTPEQKTILDQTIAHKAPNSVPNHYLSYLSSAQVQGLASKDKILRLSGAQKASLRANQVALFEPREMTPDFVQALGNEGLQALNNERYAACCQALAPQQLARLNSAHIPLIQRLPSLKLQHLSISSLQLIKTDQVQLLSSTDLNCLQEASLLLAIPKESYPELNSSTKMRLKQAINSLDDPSLLQEHHLTFLQPHSPAFQALRDPALLAQLEPSLFSQLTPNQLMELYGYPLRQELVQALSVDQLAYLDDDCISLLSSQQIAQLTDANQREIALLSERQIRQMAQFPAHLIASLTPVALTYLNPNRLNLEQVPPSQRIHLSDLQLNALYRQPGDRFKHVIQGLLFPLVFLPKLAVQFLFNSLALTVSAIFGIFSASWRSQAKERAEETFIHAPIRTLAGFWILFDYLKYKRLCLEHGGE